MIKLVLLFISFCYMLALCRDRVRVSKMSCVD